MTLNEACAAWLADFGLDAKELETEARNLQKFLVDNVHLSHAKVFVAECRIVHNRNYQRQLMADRRAAELMGKTRNP